MRKTNFNDVLIKRIAAAAAELIAVVDVNVISTEILHALKFMIAVVLM